MVKELVAGKSILAAGAAAVLCGLTLYAVGETLSYLFRDVDPKRIEMAEEADDDFAAEEPEAEPV